MTSTRLRLTLEMSADAITEACAAHLTGVHDVHLASCIDHPAEDVDVIWLADGTAVLSIRLWQEVEPPFRHAVAVMSLEFENGAVDAVENVARRSFGA